MYFLEAAAGGSKVGQLVTDASTATDGLLSIGTKLFNWALENPIFVLGIILMIVFAIVGLVKKFSH